MYKYYKIGMPQKEFDSGFNHFVKNDNKFLEILNDCSYKLKIEIYEKYNRMGVVSSKHFNYVIVNVEGDSLNEESLNLVFSDYLKKIDIKSRKVMSSCLYFIFVIFNTNEINNDLLTFIKKGFNIDKKGKYDRYVTIPVVFEKNKETLYVGCYPDNKLDAQWFGKDMIIWMLENLHDNNIEFNKISLVKSGKKEKYVSNISNYENIYTKDMVLELRNKKITQCLAILMLVYIMYYFFITSVFLIIFPIILLIRCFYILFVQMNDVYSRFNKIKLNDLNMFDLKENLNYIWKNDKRSLGSIVFIDRYMTMNFDEIFNINQYYYIILLDDYYEKDLLKVVKGRNTEFKKNILILKNDNDEYLEFIKDDNISMKKKFLKIIGKLL